MYIYIQYIEIIKDEYENSPSLLSIESLQTLQSSLAGTESKTLMVNPDCPIQILLDYVCTEINIDKNSDYDFCEFDTGEMVNIKSLKPWLYPINILKPKQTYIIVFYEKDEFGQFRKLEPLISRQSKQYSETLLRIKRKLSNSARRTSSSIRKPKPRKGSGSSKGSTADSFSSFKEARQKKRTSSTSGKSRKSSKN